jgi:hypothetical protein
VYTLPLRKVQESQVVRSILRRMRDYSVTLCKWQCVKRHVPCTGGVFDKCNFLFFDPQEFCETRVEAVQFFLGLYCCFIATGFSFKFEMFCHSAEYAVGHQGRTCIVQVYDIGTRRRFSPKFLNSFY